MLFYYSKALCSGLLLFMVFVMISAGFVYYINLRRPTNDPKKRDIHPIAIFLAPITFPLIIFLTIFIFIVRIITYGAFVILFLIALAASFFLVRLIFIPLLKASNLFLIVLRKILEAILRQLEGEGRLQSVFLQVGLVCFILGNALQLMALKLQR